MKTAVENCKPCPFCGCETIVIEPFQKGKGRGWYLHCNKCLMGYRQLTISYTLEWLQERMVEKWNTRTVQQFQSSEISDEEIEKESKIYALFLNADNQVGFIQGARFYRDQLRKTNTVTMHDLKVADNEYLLDE